MKILLQTFLIIAINGMNVHAQYNFIKSTNNSTLGFQLRTFPTADKGWVVFTMDSLKLSKYNNCGQIEWNKKYNIPNAAIGLSDFIKTSNGDYLLLTRMPLANDFVSLITRINSQGIIVWSKSYQDAAYSQFPYSVSEDALGNIYLFANVENITNNDFFNLITKVDANGNILWSKFYDQGGIWGGAITTVDNGLLIRTGSNFIKIDSAGNVQWHSSISGLGYNYFAAIEVSDGYIFTGSVNGNQNIGFAKLDKLGNLFWSYRKTLNLPGNIPLFCKKSNGDFTASFMKGTLGNSPTTIIEFDKDLNIVKQSSIDFSGVNLIGKVLCFTVDNFPVVSGIAGNEIFTAKLDADYKSFCDAATPLITATDEPITQSFVSTNAVNYPLTAVNRSYIVDTFSISISTICYVPKYLNLGKDTTYCENTTIILQNQHTDTFETYLWSTGETTQTITPDQIGSYWLHATYNCGENIVADTITISIIDGLVNDLGADLLICNDSAVVISADECVSCIYTWSTGDTLSTIEITKAGNYWLTINHGNGCILTDTLNAYTVKCDCDLYLPNAFTPNYDGINDVFKPIYDCDIASYTLKIFNRWGALIYVTQDVHSFWDGTINSKKALEGIYIYNLSYQPILEGKIQKAIIKTGTVAVVY